MARYTKNKRNQRTQSTTTPFVHTCAQAFAVQQLRDRGRRTRSHTVDVPKFRFDLVRPTGGVQTAKSSHLAMLSVRLRQSVSLKASDCHAASSAISRSTSERDGWRPFTASTAADTAFHFVANWGNCNCCRRSGDRKAVQRTNKMRSCQQPKRRIRNTYTNHSPCQEQNQKIATSR